MAETSSDPDIVTPAGRQGVLGRLFAGQWLQGLAARLGAYIARRVDKPFRFGGNVIAVRHAHVSEMLRRDLSFGIAAVNGNKINDVNGGPFVLGIDRSAQLELERRALYMALAAIDFGKIREETRNAIDERLRNVPAGGEVDVVNDYARPVAASTARCLFGLSAPPEPLFTDAVRSIFAHTFLNIADDTAVRDRAVKAGTYMCRWFVTEIEGRRTSGAFGSDMMGWLLRQGLLDDDGIRRTLGGMLVGSIDTTAGAVARIVKVIGRDPHLQTAIRGDLDDPVRMQGWCNEALRRWPHNPIVIRKATCSAELAGRTVEAGDRVIAWTQAAMLDPSVFDAPHSLRPDRDPAAYLHFGAGVHPCAGRPVNRFQIPLLVGELLRRGLKRVGSVEWVGPFPDRLMVTLAGD